MPTPEQWYIVAQAGEQRAELVGPFRRKLDAESELELVTERMHEIHPEQAASASFTVEQGEQLHGVSMRAGTKNRVLGYRTDLTGWIFI